jgi:hypothetical protein
MRWGLVLESVSPELGSSGAFTPPARLGDPARGFPRSGANGEVNMTDKFAAAVAEIENGLTTLRQATPPDKGRIDWWTRELVTLKTQIEAEKKSGEKKSDPSALR